MTRIRWDLLGKREAPFKLIGTLLPNEPVIVETGTIRVADNWAGDGQSTVVWDQFAFELGGSVTTIDIDPGCVDLVYQLGLSRTLAVTRDSVAVLRTMIGPVDFLYLDSFDINFADPEPAQQHHLREIAAAWHLLRSGSIVAVDDNQPDAGKGALVAGFLEDRNAVELFNGYVRIWRI